MRKNQKIDATFVALMSLVGLTTVSALVLTATKVSADDVVDDVSITVPISCTMSGTGQNSHTAEIPNGTYQANIGTTTMNVLCNDASGFSIYAAGFTGEEVGGNDSNKLIGTEASSNAKIVTGTATTAGNPDVSNWAMKLATDSETSYPLTLTTGYNAFHEVPNEFTKVATRLAGTDVGQNATGSTLTTTYAAYISKTQAADTYSGKVKYVLVHPNDGAAPSTGVAVTYNSNGMTFPGGGTTNAVTYVEDCNSGTYITTTPQIAKSPNVADDGTQSGAYASDANVLTPVTVTGADKVKVVVRYGLDTGTMLAVIEGNYDGSGAPDNYEMLQGQSAGTATYTFEGDTVTFFLMNQSGSAPTTGYDYGFYAEVYGIYNSEPAGIETTALCSYTAGSGTNMEPNHYKGSWYIDNESNTFTDESEIANYISEHSEEVSASGLTIYASNPYAIVYDGNTASAGTMHGFTTNLSSTSDTPDLMAPNFKKTGYGFAGWSEDSNATVNSSSTIYGPNQNIDASNLTFNQDENKTAMLYAVWVPTSGTMQNFSCSSLSSGQVTALTDSRDNNVYTVAKHADGNCWMMENLRLDNTATISSSNTNNPASGFTALSASTDDWCSDYNDASCVNQNKLNTNNTNLGGTNASNTPLINGPGQYNGSNASAGSKGTSGNNYSWYAYGNYYNWYSATAGTGTYSVSSGNATGDICPSGWSMPTGGSGGQFSILDSNIGGTGSYQESAEASNRWRTYPRNFIYSGGWYESLAGPRGVGGLYWSRTAHDSYYAYELGFGSGYFDPEDGVNGKVYGISVRCLAQ